MSDWYRRSAAQVLAELGSDQQAGLSRAEACQRLERFGPNGLVEREGRSPLVILLEQFSSIMVIVLVVAGVISLLLREFTDAGAIFAIVVLNAVLGFVQEYRAEKAMAALKKLAVPKVRLKRDGHIQEISAGELVPGDVVLLEAGSHVPADGRLLEAVNLRVSEAALTGESEPVAKKTEVLTEPAPPLGDRHNMVYMGTAVVAGRGMMVVTETGMRTELGRIAGMLQTVKREPTPLQKRLEQLAKGLAGGALVVVAIVFALGLLRGQEFRLMFLVAISLAVAAVPEGLPAVVTIALTLGAHRMLARNALMRRLSAVETLGSVTVICSDKTGTLTENRMTVTMLDVAGERLDLSVVPAVSCPVFSGRSGPAFLLLLAGGALCNDALLEPAVGGEKSNVRVIGDPTEGALVLAATQLGLNHTRLVRMLPRVGEIQFSSERKRMSTVHQLSGEPESENEALLIRTLAEIGGSARRFIFTKGAVDVLLERSGSVWREDGIEPLSPKMRDRIEASHNSLTQKGMRVLGVAFRPLSEAEADSANLADEALERELVFVGMTGMIDPARPEVRAAVATCRQAGIRPVMVTGDHPLTARFIAADIGIGGETAQPWLTGQDLARLSVAELEPIAEQVTVYARVAPEQKLKIVQALQNRGEIVAMTGDGVNDAPALKKADIGVAMGITGTDVAKEASDMVLLDDNFATIVAAVREGRVIYDNIRKFIKYILSANAGEIWVMLLAPFLGMPLPLLPLQILWINLVTDGLPSLVLAVEPAEQDVMRRPPRNPKENIFGQGLGWYIVWVGLLMAIVSLGMGYWAWRQNDPGWQTMVFMTVTMSELFQVLTVRLNQESAFSRRVRFNGAIAGTFGLTLGLQLAVVYVPFMQQVFRTRPLALRDLGISLALSTVVFWAVELEKFVRRTRGKSRSRAAN